MAEPEKKFLAIPTVLPTQPFLIEPTTRDQARENAIRQALGGKKQMIIYEAVEYVEPDVTPEIVTATVKPIT